MSPSGVIYAIIAVMWAAVLVPMWLRRHDEVTESRSVDRFQGAMRTLSRRETAGDRREVLVPRRPSSPPVHADGEPLVLSAAQQAAQRRRHVLLALAGLLVLVLGLGLLGFVSLWATIAPALLVVGYVLQARSAQRRETAIALAARRRRAAASRRSRQVAAAQSVRIDRPAQPARPARQRPAAPAQVEPAAVAVAITEPEFYDQVAERAWAPVPVPVPTYVSAPKAPRSVRVIDLTLPGSWTSGRLDAAVTGEPVEAVDQPADERDLIVTGEVLVERRRAVGD